MKSAVLLEDDENLRESLSLALEELGFERVYAVGSLVALQAVGRGAIASTLAILDVNLGHRQPSGLDAARWLREEGFAGHVLFLTGHAGAYPELRRRLREPKTSLIEKPAPIARLAGVITEATDAAVR